MTGVSDGGHMSLFGCLNLHIHKVLVVTRPGIRIVTEMEKHLQY